MPYIAFQTNPQDVVPVLCIVNLRDKLNPPLPNGYYGNDFAFFMAITIAGKLYENPLSYAVELLKNAKNNVTDEYLRSMIDLMMIKGRPHIYGVGSYVVTSVTHVGFGKVDFGWGKLVFVGSPRVGWRPCLECVASIFLVRIVKERMG